MQVSRSVDTIRALTTTDTTTQDNPAAESMDFSPIQITVIILCALFVGVAKSGFAGGVGILATPLLAASIGSARAVGILLPMLLAADAFNFYHFWKKWERKAMVMILPGTVVGVLIGWPLLHHIKGREEYLSRFIGFVALIFGAYALYKEPRGEIKSPFRPNRVHGLAAGTATGVVSTLAHQGGVITQLYLVPQKLSPAGFVGTTTVIYGFLNFIKIPVYLWEDLITIDSSFWSAASIPFAFIGTFIGVYLNRRMSGKLFNRIILVIVLITGIKLALWQDLVALWQMVWG